VSSDRAIVVGPHDAASAPQVPVEYCLLDKSVARAHSSGWVDQLPSAPVAMITEHVAELRAPGTATRRSRQLLDAISGLPRFTLMDRPRGLAQAADPVLDQIWRLGPAHALLLVTLDEQQAAQALDILRLAHDLGSYRAHLSPVQRGLLTVRANIALTPWEHPRREPSAPTPWHETGRARPLFAALRRGQAFIDQTQLDIPVFQTGSVLRTGSGDSRRLISAWLGGAPGGEGFAYLTDAGDVCKVYKPEAATNATAQKLKLMVERPLGHSHVCWPTDRVLAEDGKFAGYLMPRARGELLRDAVTETDRASIERMFPGRRKQLAELAIRICSVVDCLHRNNILLGDLNDGNIIVDQDLSPWFIDTDSYQFERFPAPVAHPAFIHPALMDTDYWSTFRLPEHDRFALAVLLFKILFLGSDPYEAPLGEERRARKERIFRFRIATKASERFQATGWPETTGHDAFVWSWLPRDLKEAFAAVFVDGKETEPAAGIAAHPYGAAAWRERLKGYLRYLDRVPAACELFPNGLKDPRSEAHPGPGYETQVCAYPPCGRTFNRRIGSRQLYCRTCNKTTVRRPCSGTVAGKPCKKQAVVTIPELHRGTRFLCRSCERDNHH
jgi:hypothetical protein